MKNEIIKSWYKKNHPSDEAVEDLRDQITFSELFVCLVDRKDMYELMGENIDSVIRERLFEGLATAMNYTYDNIHNLWMVSVGLR